MESNVLIQEIRTELSNYSSIGKIDDLSMYRWIADELRRFGANIMKLHEDVVEVKNKKCSLPLNFHALHFAYKCEPFGYEVKQESVAHLQRSLIWKERIERDSRWSSCDPCCKEEGERTIVENVYFNDIPVTFRYSKPQLLKLGKSRVVNPCIGECRNKVVRDCPNEIVINSRTLYANFDGFIYISYYGIEVDEEGLPIIVDSPLGRLAAYIEYYLKFKIFEKLVSNGEDSNIIELMKFFDNKAQAIFAQAMTDVKMMTYDLSVYNDISAKNRKRFSHFEKPFLR